jgi:hypothetical protein
LSCIQLGPAIVLVNVATIFIDYPASARLTRIGTMKKRALVLRRAAMRKILFVLVLTAVLAFESLAMTQVYRGVSLAPVPRQMTIDPAVVFQGW